jgi:hypothetical protein
MCRVELGKQALATRDLAAASAEFEEAHRIARTITRRDVLIAALHSRGRVALLDGQLNQAGQLLDNRVIAKLCPIWVDSGV